jgi:hypothetical protein
MTVKISGTDGIDTAQLRAPDGSPVAMTIDNSGVVALPNTPVVSGNVPFSAKNNASQSLSANTWTTVNLQVENFDPNNWFSANKFQPTVAGYYCISGMVSIGGAATIAVAVNKNGSERRQGNYGASSYAGLAHAIFYLNGTTDYAILEAFTTSSQTINGTVTPSFFEGFSL